MGVFCALFIGANLLPAAVFFIKKRRREAFQALVIPLFFWPTFLIGYAIVDGSLGPFSSSKLFLVILSVATIAGSVWFVAIRALPWPAVPAEELTATEVAAIDRRARGLSVVLLACYAAIGGFGVLVIAWSLRLFPEILEPGSGGAAQMLLAFLVVPVLLAGGFILFTGIAGVTASWKDFKNHVASGRTLGA
jgi:hypothetical protein